MKSERIALIKGALRYSLAVRSQLTEATMQAVGIQPVEWEVFTQPMFWSAKEARVAQITLSKAIALGYEISRVPNIGILAEHVAGVIAVTVQPANWGVVCSLGASGLDGTRILQPDGDEVLAHETVSGERLLAMVLVASQLRAEVFRSDELNQVESLDAKALKTSQD